MKYYFADRMYYQKNITDIDGCKKRSKNSFLLLGRYVCFAVILALLTFCAGGCVTQEDRTSVSQTTAAPERVVILCYGDSNTYGYDPGNGGSRYEEEMIWPYILAQKLGAPFRTLNQGLNGRTTAYDYAGSPDKNGLTYFSSYLESEREEDMIIFMLGSNDFFLPRLSAEDIAEGMEALVTEAEEKARTANGEVPEIVIVAPPVMDSDLLDKIYGEHAASMKEKSYAVVPLYKKIAEEHGCLFLDASESLETSSLDGVHLTENGHAKLAGMLYDLITESSELYAEYGK